MNAKQKKLFKEWLKTEPKVIQDLARKFPPGTVLRSHGKTLYVMSYYEDGGLGVSNIDPSEDYERAMDEKVYACKCCIDKEKGNGM